MKESIMMTRLFHNPVDLSKVSTLIYHLPEGPALSVEMDGSDFFFDLEMELFLWQGAQLFKHFPHIRP